jgi:Tfp pilus assembly protein PilX
MSYTQDHRTIREKKQSFFSRLLPTGNYPLHPSRGFTLYLAVLIGGIVLAICLSLADFALKQVIISTTGRDSQYAFYAADSGIECAFYWDFKYFTASAFATSNPPSTMIPTSGVRCNNQDITSNWDRAGTASNATTTFAFLLTPEPYCVQVIVGKNGNNTTVEARGYNQGTLDVDVSTGEPYCSSSNPRTVERGIRVHY